MLGLLKSTSVIFLIAFAGFLISKESYRQGFEKSLKDISLWISSNYKVLLVAVLGFAAILRFYNLTSREFWYDEAFSSLLINRSWASFFTLMLKDVHPPLYYVLLKAWSYIFGFSDLGLRSFSVVFGIAAVFMATQFVYTLTKNKSAALISGVIFAVNPFLIQYSQETRSYALLSFLILTVAYALFNKRWGLLALFLSLTFLTHYMNLFLFPFVFFVVLAYNLLDKEVSWLSFSSLLFPFVVVLVWSPFLYNHWKGGSDLLGWIPPAKLSSLFYALSTFLFGEVFSKSRLILIFTLLGAFLTGVFIWQTFYKKSKQFKFNFLSLVSLSLIPICIVLCLSIFGGMDLFIDRVLIGYFALLLTLIIYTFSKAHPLVWIPAFLLYAFYSLNFLQQKSVENPGYNELIKFSNHTNKKLVLTDPMHYLPMKHYLFKASPQKLAQIKVQLDTPGDWPLIFQEDRVEKENLNEPFYLVNYGEISDWQSSIKVGSFYLYEWSN
ncbi:hypothetical protein GF360_02930 [candidate division WWE3 bacterium]|nr:hypothetical protein [candidate division WWE3 bacterium]